MRKFVLLFASICCVVFMLIYATQQTNPIKSPIQKLLSEMPNEDYQALDKLFRCLIFENYFAYTLFGSKPMTYHGAFYRRFSIRPTNKFMSNINSRHIFLSYWKIWKKYSSLPIFKNSNFIFIEEKRPELFGVHFINKKNVLQCFKENINVFHEVLGEDIKAEKLIQTLITSKDIYETLKDSQILYGIFFGFGAENAKAFYKKFDLGLPLLNSIPFHSEPPELYSLPLPYFVTFYPNDETTRLRKQYTRERDEILKIYSKGNFLEITLTQLLSNN